MISRQAMDGTELNALGSEESVEEGKHEEICGDLRSFGDVCICRL